MQMCGVWESLSGKSLTWVEVPRKSFILSVLFPSSLTPSKKKIVPYGWLSNKDAFQQIQKGEQLPKPENCPSNKAFCNNECVHRLIGGLAAVYELMQTCWNLDANGRPSFDTLLT